MAKNSWQIYLDKAKKTKIESERFLTEAVRVLMAHKGFTGEQLLLFEACFASGDETVIHFNRECEFADLGIFDAKDMTKDEIVNCLSKYASKKTEKLLKGE